MSRRRATARPPIDPAVMVRQIEATGMSTTEIGSAIGKDESSVRAWRDRGVSPRGPALAALAELHFKRVARR